MHTHLLKLHKYFKLQSDIFFKPYSIIIKEHAIT